MSKQSTTKTDESSVTWDRLEAWIRGHVQQFIQQVLEEEVTDLLGRQKSVRRRGVDGPTGYRNGYGQSRRLTLSCGTITVRRPRVRECEERLVSRVLPFFKRKSTAVDHLLPELYLHGLAQGDFDLALRGLLGRDAPLSGSTIARLKTPWQTELEHWQSRSLEDLETVYLWVDGLYVKAGLEKNKAALLVVLAALSNGQKVILAMVPGHRESTASWSAVLRDLKARGLRAPASSLGMAIWASGLGYGMSIRRSKSSAVGITRSSMCSTNYNLQPNRFSVTFHMHRRPRRRNDGRCSLCDGVNSAGIGRRLPALSAIGIG